MRGNAPTTRKAQRLAESVGALLRAEDVAARLAIGKRTLWRMVGQGRVPLPDVRLGRIVRWRPTTIAQWIDQEARRQARREGGGQ